MALSKIIAEGVDLTDDYAFTGTVTGAGEITASTTAPSEGGAATTNVVQGLAKAWVNFKGTGTVATRDSLNISGLVDGGVGVFTVSFSSSFANSDYAAVGTGSETISGTVGLANRDTTVRTLSTSSLNVYNYNSGNKDFISNYVATHGDLA